MKINLIDSYANQTNVKWINNKRSKLIEKLVKI